MKKAIVEINEDMKENFKNIWDKVTEELNS